MRGKVFDLIKLVQGRGNIFPYIVDVEESINDHSTVILRKKCYPPAGSEWPPQQVVEHSWQENQLHSDECIFRIITINFF